MLDFNFWDWFNAIIITAGIILWARVVWKRRPTRKGLDRKYVLHCDACGKPELPPMRKLAGPSKLKGLRNE